MADLMVGTALALVAAAPAGAAEQRLASPDGALKVTVSDSDGQARYAADIRQDGATPTDLVATKRTVTAGDVLTLKLAPSGGAAVRLTPAR